MKRFKLLLIMALLVGLVSAAIAQEPSPPKTPPNSSASKDCMRHGCQRTLCHSQQGAAYFFEP